ITLDGIETLEDIIRPGLDLLFVGYNPSLPAMRRRQYYGNPANAFWKELHACGLVDEFLGTPGHDVRVLDYGIGITDVVKRPTATSRDLARSEYVAGFGRLIGLLDRFRPHIACFVGIGLGRQFADLGLRAPDGVRIEGIYSTSGLANGKWRERREGFGRLKALVDDLRKI
ncbi:MAG: mismatch-specific DNA-glycosylase, partial [Candidatus Sericytochromatia bacterium]|nr:mismatch-specific DNA-glycosylase [Candidatus Tanganyikabacteria bacterium]